MIRLMLEHVSQKIPDLDGVCIKYILDGIIREGSIAGLPDDDHKHLQWHTHWPIAFRKLTGAPGWTSLLFVDEVGHAQEMPLVAPAPTWNRVLQVSGNKRALSALKAKCRDLVRVSMWVRDEGKPPSAIQMENYKYPCNYGTFMRRYYKQVLGRTSWPTYMERMVDNGQAPWDF